MSIDANGPLLPSITTSRCCDATIEEVTFKTEDIYNFKPIRIDIVAL